MPEQTPDLALPKEPTQSAHRLPHWRPALSVGNADLDAQHIVLLEMGRNLLDSLDETPPALGRAIGELDDLLSASLEHDTEEERILASNGCPSLDAHHLSHTITRARLKVLLDNARQGQVDAPALRHALLGWMQHHIGEFDLPVKAYLACPVRDGATTTPTSHRRRMRSDLNA